MKDPFLGLIMFHQLQEGFGWVTFKEFFREYRAMAKDPSGVTPIQIRKKEIYGYHIFDNNREKYSAVFEKWGIPISEKVKSDLNKYAVWI